MTNQNQEILDALEEKTIHDYIDEYHKIEKIIEDKLGKLENCGSECHQMQGM